MRNLFTEANATELLDEAIGKSRREIERLIARRAPKPDVPESIRRIPEQASMPTAAATVAAATAMSPPACTPKTAVLVPLSEERFRVTFTASTDLYEKIEHARALMRHLNPSGDLAAIIERALELLIRELEKQRLGKVEQPRRARGPRTRATSRARRGARCTSVMEVSAHSSPRTASAVRRGSSSSSIIDSRSRSAGTVNRRTFDFCVVRIISMPPTRPSGASTWNGSVARRGRRRKQRVIREPDPSALDPHQRGRGDEVDGKVAAVPEQRGRGEHNDGAATCSAVTGARGRDEKVDEAPAPSVLPHQRGRDEEVDEATATSVLPHQRGGAGACDDGDRAVAATDARSAHDIVRAGLLHLGFRSKDADGALASLPLAVWSEPLEAIMRRAIARLT